jgi:hypothetical protein
MEKIRNTHGIYPKHIIRGTFVVLGLFAMLALAGRSIAIGAVSGGPHIQTGASQTVVPQGQGGADPSGPVPLSQQYAGRSPQSLTPPTGASAVAPPVTVDRVRTYVLRHPLNLSGKEAANMQVENIQLTTAGELKKLLNHVPWWDNWSADHPMVYVWLSGSFPVYDMDNAEHTYPFAYRVFDARTGNELQAGIVSR